MVLGIYGSGAVGRGAKEIADLQDCWSQIIFIDDTVPADIFKGIPRMPFENFKRQFTPQEAKVVIAIGEPECKISLFTKVQSHGYQFGNVIHPQAYVSPDAQLGDGIIVQMGVLIAVDTIIGDNVSLEPYAVVSHDSVIEQHSQISAHVTIAGHCRIQENSYIGIGATIKENTKIGKNTIIGMGSVVLKDIPENVIAFGNPAIPTKPRNDKRIFQ